MKSILLAAVALLAAPAFAQGQTPPSHADTSAQIGGLQPSAPALQGTPAPGSPVVFKQAPDPSTAFPPPAAEEKYPTCKRGQFDKCEQAGSGDGNVNKAAVKHHGAKHHAKKHHWKKAAAKPAAAAPAPAK